MNDCKHEMIRIDDSTGVEYCMFCKAIVLPYYDLKEK